MKYVLTILMCLIAISCAGCGASLWAYSDDSVDTVAGRGGLVVDRFEVGAEHYRLDDNTDWDAYALIYLLPDETINPYVGVHNDNLKIRETSELEPFIGAKAGPVFIEYQDRTDELFYGLSHTFRW